MALGHRVLADGDGLLRLEKRLRAKRRRLKIYWIIWGGLAAVTLNSVVQSPAPLVQALGEWLPIVCLWGLWLTVLGLRVRFLHPRLLAAQRRLMSDLGRLPVTDGGVEDASDSGLLDDLRQAQHRLRRRCTGLGIHQSEFLGELAHGGDAAEKVGAELALTADALAHSSLRGTPESQLAPIQERRRRAWLRLEAYLASLLACECEAQLDSGFLQRRAALELLRHGQRLLAS